MQDVSLRHFLLYARNHISPILHTDARDSLANSYADLRSQADERTLPVGFQCNPPTHGF